MDPARSDIGKFLGSVEPFDALSAQDLRRIARVSRVRSYAKGETVFSEGEAADSVWVLLKGRVQIFKHIAAGRPLALESLRPGEIFGTLCRLGAGGRRYPCTAVCASAVWAVRIPEETFLEHYMKSPGLMRGICVLCSERLRDMQDLRCMGQEPVPVRIAATLLRLHQSHGKTIPLAKREIAELVGAAVETAFRAMSDLQRKGVLTSRYGRVHLEKPEELRKIIGNP